MSGCIYGCLHTRPIIYNVVIRVEVSHFLIIIITIYTNSYKIERFNRLINLEISIIQNFFFFIKIFSNIEISTMMFLF